MGRTYSCFACLSCLLRRSPRVLERTELALFPPEGPTLRWSPIASFLLCHRWKTGTRCFFTYILFTLVLAFSGQFYPLQIDIDLDSQSHDSKVSLPPEGGAGRGRWGHQDLPGVFVPCSPHKKALHITARDIEVTRLETVLIKTEELSRFTQ